MNEINPLDHAAGLRSNRLNAEGLYVLVDGVDFAQNTRAPKLVSLIQQLIAAKVNLIQLRDKTLNDRQLVQAGRLINQLTGISETSFIMNDRVDLAVASGADGVHMGQEDLAVSDARLVLGHGKLIGVSTHSIAQAQSAVASGADYIGVGPVFPSRTKSFEKHVGLELVRQVAAEIQLPAFAIGGIDHNNVGQVVAAGMRRVAVGAAVGNSASPGAAAESLICILLSGRSVGEL